MSLAKIEYDLSRKLKNLKTGHFSNIVSLTAHEVEKLDSEIPTLAFSSSQIEFNTSNLKFLDFFDNKPRLRCTHQVVAIGNTNSNLRIANIFDEKNSTFEPFMQSSMNEKISWSQGTEKLTWDNSNLNPAVLNILALSFDDELMKKQGFSTDLVGLSGKLRDYYAVGNSGVNFETMNAAGLNSNLASFDNVMKNYAVGSRCVKNVFTDILNNPNRIKFIGIPSFSLPDNPTFLLNTTYNYAKNTYEPTAVVAGTGAGSVGINETVYSDSKIGLSGAVPIVAGRIQQTWTVQITEPLLCPLFSNPFTNSAEKPLCIFNQNPILTLNISDSYVQQAFKIVYPYANGTELLNSVKTTMIEAKLLMTTFTTDLLNSNEQNGKMKMITYVPTLIPGLPNQIQQEYINKNSEMEFSFSYKPSTMEKHTLIFIDNEMYNKSSNKYGAINDPDTAVESVYQNSTNALSNYDFGEITDFEMIVNNKNILQYAFANKEDKMQWLNEITSEILRGNKYELLSKLSGKQKREYLNGDKLVVNGADICQSLQNVDTGLSFLILDNARLLNMYSGEGEYFPLCDYSTGDVSVQYKIKFKRRQNASEKLNKTPYYNSLSNSSGIAPVSTDIMNKWRLQIYGMKIFAYEQDYMTGKFESYEVKTTGDEIASAYMALENKKVNPYTDDMALYGSGWFSDAFNFVKRNIHHIPRILKGAVDVSRKVEEHTRDNDDLKGVNRFVNSVSNFSKNIGYGKRKPRRI